MTEKETRTVTVTIDLTPDPAQVRLGLLAVVESNEEAAAELERYVEHERPVNAPYVVLEALERAIGEKLQIAAEATAMLAEPWAVALDKGGHVS